MQKITTFLMFEGAAEAAMNFYVSLFDDSEIGEIVRLGAEHGDKAGQIETATFTLAGQTFMCIDSTVRHAFGFTPSMSLFVECRSNDEITNLFTRLADGGQVMMPLASYPFAEQFAWVSDRFGVSWQLRLA